MKEHHILALSGGKDSTALAFFIKENMPEIFEKLEFVFSDTQCELPETYDYLNKIEIFLNKTIKKILPEKSFEYLMQTHGYLPSPIKRWCTVELKAKPFEKYINNLFKTGIEIVYLYMGIRADEPKRIKYGKYKDKRIKEVYPFVDFGWNKKDIINILYEIGIGMPKYYDWSNRSGCYFCPFQTKMNWINLYENHPDLFMKAKRYEDERNKKTEFKKVGWNMDMLLEDMIKPENIKKIKDSHHKRKNKTAEKSTKLIDIIP